MENRDKPAFPIGPEHFSDTGLTKREHIAAMCLQGLLANPELLKPEYKESVDLHALAVLNADALLTQLEK
jgi:hypothetical protein